VVNASMVSATVLAAPDSFVLVGFSEHNVLAMGDGCRSQRQGCGRGVEGDLVPVVEQRIHILHRGSHLVRGAGSSAAE
jgi:hypothetical protein